MRRSKLITTVSKLSALLFTLGILLSCVSISQEADAVKRADFLTGSWKAQGLDEYEVWQKINDKLYSGYAYRIKDGEKIIWEEMQVSLEHGLWQLAVKVPGQNNNATVIFKLQSNPQDEWLFVNSAHDFPKRILYRKISEDQWFADVRGDDNKGFSIVIERQD